MKLPVFLCDEVGDQWTFWCPFCRCQHWHSAGAGHRVAHCHSPEGTAAFDRGYILRRRRTSQAADQQQPQQALGA
jgi:hypothetical protein